MNKRLVQAMFQNAKVRKSSVGFLIVTAENQLISSPKFYKSKQMAWCETAKYLNARIMKKLES